MAPGITLVILGAILAFAVRTDASVVDLQTVGLIFMLAGGAIIAYFRREKHEKQVVTRVEESSNGGEPTLVKRETVIQESVSEADDTDSEKHSKPAF
ncbi:MAG TPA: DUF6458 family protein [Nocardioidaceae bacterium]|nr:DUF6458 family protein [Nocardioidaceae bacterium]